MSNQGKIYCAHCIFTGKKYIGQTRQKLLCDRIASHFVDANKNYRDGKFQRALKKYGRNGFIWGVIEEAEKDYLVIEMECLAKIIKMKQKTKC